MKRMKIALMAVFAIVMGTTFTSCLNSDNESVYDFYDVVTYTDYSAYGRAFICDTYGYTVYPTNGNSLFGSGDYPERACLYFKLKEGEVLTEGKTSYEAAIVPEYSYAITVKEFCDKKDTLNIDNEDTEYGKGSPTFSAIAQPTPTNNYLNVIFKAAVSQQKSHMQYFNIYPEKAEGNTLYVTLHQDEVTENETSVSAEIFMNFRLPQAYKLKDMLGDLEYEKLEFFGPKNDSINIVINAKSSGNNLVSSKAGKVRIQGAEYLH